MKLAYRPLFSVEVSHDYYRGACGDIGFVVPAASEQALRASRIQLRVRDGRLIALYEVAEGGAPVAPVSGQTLLVGLAPRHPHFANFTALVVAGGLPLYANPGGTASLAPPVAATFLPDTLRVMPSLATRPLDLSLRRGSETIAAQTLAAGADEALFAAAGWPAGLYTLRETDGVDTRDRTLLREPELAAEPLWGALAITLDPAFHANPPAFAISLTARQEVLKYYVVARNYGAAEFGQLNVADAGAADDGRPVVPFERIAAADFAPADLPPDLLGDASARIALFQSTAAVPRRDRGYRKLQLRRNAEVLVKHLPQAGPDRPQAQFIVHLSKP
nr:hypothetical protein [Dechloromonas sp.]